LGGSEGGADQKEEQGDGYFTHLNPKDDWRKAKNVLGFIN
jgi:hypothetical protein